MPVVLSLLAGMLFGAGLAISDMVNPQRVLNFLDVAGRWDPTLLCVMAAGVGMTAVGYWLVRHRRAPLLGGTFNLPAQQQIDGALIVGAATFGVGWGLAGICPGPALTDLVTLQPKVFGFVAAMLLGMIAARRSRARLQAINQAPLR